MKESVLKIKEFFWANKNFVLRTLIYNVGVYSIAFILAYNGYKELARGYEHVLSHFSSSYSGYADIPGISKTVRVSIKETFPWAILVFAGLYIVHIYRRKEQDLRFTLSDYTRVLLLSACALDLAFISRRDALIVINLSLLLFLLIIVVWQRIMKGLSVKTLSDWGKLRRGAGWGGITLRRLLLLSPLAVLALAVGLHMYGHKQSGVERALPYTQDVGTFYQLSKYPHICSSYLRLEGATAYPPSNLSDGDPNTMWHISRPGRPEWVMVDFGEGNAEVVNSFRALPRRDEPSSFWRSAVLQGSNNTIIWAEVADVSLQEEPGQPQWFNWNFTNEKKYRYYRLFATQGFYAGKFVAFAEWQMGHIDLSTVPVSQVQSVKPSLIKSLLASLSPPVFWVVITSLTVALLVVSVAKRAGLLHLRDEITIRVISFFCTHQKFLPITLVSLIVVCSYGLPVLCGFTWSPFIHSEQGRFEYVGRWLYTYSISGFNPVSDAQFTEPRNQLLSTYLRERMLPLWNPYEATGVPFAADFESKALFPLNMMQALLPYWTWDLFYLFRVWLAGLFTYLLLRQYSLSLPACIFGTTGYMLSGPVALYLTMEETVNGVFILPWLIYGADKLAREYRVKHVFGFSIPIALSIYAGQPKLTLLSVSTALAYFFVASIHYHSISPSKIFKHCLKATLPVVIGLLLAAPQLFISAELFVRAHITTLVADTLEVDNTEKPCLVGGDAKRANHEGPKPWETFVRGAPSNIKWENSGGLILTILPNFWGIVNHAWNALYRENHWWGHPAYIGIVSYFLAFFSICSWRLFDTHRRFLVLFWSILGFIVISAAYGFILGTWVVTLPPFNFIAGYRGYVRYYAPIFVLSSMILASLGLELFIQLKKEEIKRGLLRAGIFLLAFIIGALFLPGLLEGYSCYEVADTEIFLFSLTKSVGIILLIMFSLMFLGMRCPNTTIGWCMVVMGFCELSFYLPYAFNLEWETYRFVPFLIGISGVFYLSNARMPAFFTLGAMYVIALMALIILSPFGLSNRYNPFKPTPDVSFLKEREGEFRTYGIASPLAPAYTSAFQIKDIRVITPLVPMDFAKFMIRFLSPSLPPTPLEKAPILLSHQPLSEYYQYKKFYDFLGVKYLLTKKELQLDTEPVPLFNASPELEFREVTLKKGSQLSFHFTRPLKEIGGVELSAVSSSEKNARISFLLRTDRGDVIREGVILVQKGSRGIVTFATTTIDKDYCLNLQLEDNCKFLYSPETGGEAAQVSLDAHALRGGIQLCVLRERRDLGLIYDKGVKIYESKEAFPRAYMVHKVISVSSVETAFDGLKSVDLRSVALVEGLKREFSGSHAVSTSEDDVRILEYKPCTVLLDVHASSPGLLVLTDTYYPGWEVYVDGQKVELYRVNGLVRGVCIEKDGRHEVKFVYNPKGFYVGTFLSLSTLSVILLSIAKNLWEGY